MNGTRVAFVTTLCAHYRRPLFEELSRRMDVDFFFTSAGNEWYALPEYREVADRLSTRPAVRRRDLVKWLMKGDYDVFVLNLAGRFAPLAGYAIARLRRRRVVLWVGIWAHPGGIAHRLSRLLARHLYRAASSVVCYGPHVARFVQDESGRTAGVVSARQCVDDELFRRPVSNERPDELRCSLDVDGRKVISCVARLEVDKGVDVLLRAFSALRENHVLVVIGKGSVEDELRELAAELGIGNRTRFLGYVSQKDLPAHLQVSAVVVLPSIRTSRFLEPWGLIMNEAMAAGTAVVATTAVGAAAGGLVVHNETGIVVPERDSAALAAALEELLEDDVKRSRLARAGSEHVRAWNFEAAADVFQTAIERRAS